MYQIKITDYREHTRKETIIPYDTKDEAILDCANFYTHFGVCPNTFNEVSGNLSFELIDTNTVDEDNVLIFFTGTLDHKYFMYQEELRNTGLMPL